MSVAFKSRAMLDKWASLFVFSLIVLEVFCDPNHLGKNGTKEVLKFPQLVLRATKNGKYQLDVYNPESMTNFIQDVKAKIGNPSCELEDGNMIKSNAVKLELLEKFELSSMDVDHSMTKAVYKVIVESQGYIRCKAEIFDRGEVTSTRKLYRFSDHSFAMNINYNCTKTECGNLKALSDDLSASLNNFRHASLLQLENIKVTPVRKTEVNDSTSLIYRIDVTMFVPLALKQGAARKNLSSLKQRDVDLLSFLNEVVFHNFTDKDLSHGVCSYIRSTKFCPKKENEKLSWPITEIGMKASTHQLCITNDGGLIVLECLGDFTVGAYWDTIASFQCEATTWRMNALYQISHDVNLTKVNTNDNTIKKIELLLTAQGNEESEESAPLTNAEINYISEALSSFSQVISPADISSLANITNALMSKPEIKDQSSKVIYKNELKDAQEATNSSNRILESLDRILNGALLNDTKELIITENFVTLVMEISPATNLNRIRGLAVKKSGKSDVEPFNLENIVVLTEYDTLKDVLDMNISMAVLVPLDIYLYGYGKTHRLVINIFREDSLFGTKETVGKTSMVLSVTLDGQKYHNLDSPLVLVFEADPNNGPFYENLSSPSPCVFWDFQANDNNGDWSSYGCDLAKPRDGNQQAFDVCLCSHLTHFAELLRDHPADIISAEDKVALDLITVIGCSLSLLGLTAIAVTAVVFPNWRKGASKKVQLGLCASLTILMASFLAVSFTKGHPVDGDVTKTGSCMVAGFLLHYSILASFCWMIVAAWGQYLRLTKPLVSLNRQPHFVLKSSLFAWGLPLIPCLIVIAVNYEIYNPPNCYPTGYYLYISVLLPVVLAVAVNGTLFILILFSIYNCCGCGMGLVQLRTNQNKRRVAFRKLATVMFLFFLLGLSWIFGIMNMRYLFCITASTQGFSVFIFFVVLDKSTRGKWCNLINAKKDSNGMSSYTHSADFIRRWSQQSRTHSRYPSSRVSTLSYCPSP